MYCICSGLLRGMLFSISTVGDIKRAGYCNYAGCIEINFRLFIVCRAGRTDINPAKALERRQRLARFFRA